MHKKKKPNKHIQLSCNFTSLLILEGHQGVQEHKPILSGLDGKDRCSEDYGVL